MFWLLQSQYLKKNHQLFLLLYFDNYMIRSTQFWYGIIIHTVLYEKDIYIFLFFLCLSSVAPVRRTAVLLQSATIGGGSGQARAEQAVCLHGFHHRPSLTESDSPLPCLFSTGLAAGAGRPERDVLICLVAVLAAAPPCVSSGDGSGIRCGVCGRFNLPDRTWAEVLLRTPRAVSGCRHAGKTVLQQSGRAVQGVSATSRIPA